MKNAFIIFALPVLLCLSSSYAKADTADSFVQITCAPELQYFSFRTASREDPSLYLNDSANFSAKKLDTLEKKYGIFKAERLVNRPYTCHIPASKGRTLNAQVTLEPKFLGGRTSTNFVRVNINGKDLGLFDIEDYQIGLVESYPDNDQSFYASSCLLDVGYQVGGTTTDNVVHTVCSEYRF